MTLVKNFHKKLFIKSIKLKVKSWRWTNTFYAKIYCLSRLIYKYFRSISVDRTSPIKFKLYIKVSKDNSFFSNLPNYKANAWMNRVLVRGENQLSVNLQNICNRSGFPIQLNNQTFIQIGRLSRCRYANYLNDWFSDLRQIYWAVNETDVLCEL